MRLFTKQRASSATVGKKPQVLRRVVQKARSLLRLKPKPQVQTFSEQRHQLPFPSLNSVHEDVDCSIGQYTSGVSKVNENRHLAEDKPHVTIDTDEPITEVYKDNTWSVYYQPGLDHLPGDLIPEALIPFPNPAFTGILTAILSNADEFSSVQGQPSIKDEGDVLEPLGETPNLLDATRSYLSRHSLLASTDPRRPEIDTLRQFERFKCPPEVLPDCEYPHLTTGIEPSQRIEKKAICNHETPYKLHDRCAESSSKKTKCHARQVSEYPSVFEANDWFFTAKMGQNTYKLPRYQFTDDAEDVARYLFILFNDDVDDSMGQEGINLHPPAGIFNGQANNNTVLSSEVAALNVAQKLHKREIEKVSILQEELVAVQKTAEIPRQEQAQRIEQLSNENELLTNACNIAHEEKQLVSSEFSRLLSDLSGNIASSEVSRGLARDLQASFEARMALELALSDRSLQVARVERHRKRQINDLRAAVQERDSELAELRLQVEESEHQKLSLEEEAEFRRIQINETCPALEARIEELEMEHKAVSNASSGQSTVIIDLSFRLKKQIEANEWYINLLGQKYCELQGVKLNCGLFAQSTRDDLIAAHGFRDERDIYLVEVLALRERFADQLLVEPLTVPAHLKTTLQIEAEIIADIDQRVIKQFKVTYGAVPREIIDPDCSPYEALKAEYLDKEREEALARRDVPRRSFFDKLLKNDASFAPDFEMF